MNQNTEADDEAQIEGLNEYRRDDVNGAIYNDAPRELDWTLMHKEDRNRFGSPIYIYQTPDRNHVILQENTDGVLKIVAAGDTLEFETVSAEHLTRDGAEEIDISELDGTEHDVLQDYLDVDGIAGPTLHFEESPTVDGDGVVLSYDDVENDRYRIKVGVDL